MSGLLLTYLHISTLRLFVNFSMLFYFILFYFGKPERSPHRKSHRSGVQSYCPTGFLAHHHCPHGGRISLTIHTMQQNSRCYFHPSI